MRPLSILPLLCLLAGPALATPEDDYARLRDALPTLLFGYNTGMHLQLNAEIIRRLEGRWVLVAPLMEDGVTFPGRTTLQKACEKNGYDVAAEGNFGLSLSLPTKADPFVIHLHYAGGTTYVGSVDEAGAMARLFPGKSPEELDPNMLYSTLIANSWQGYISLIPAGEDLVLLQPVARPPELLARCP